MNGDKENLFTRAFILELLVYRFNLYLTGVFYNTYFQICHVSIFRATGSENLDKKMVTFISAI